MDNEQYAYLSAQWQQELDEAGQRILVQAARLDEIHAMMLDTFYERHLDYLMLKESIAGHERDALMEKIEQFAGISKS